jgi:hypothetical protein
MMSAHEEFRGRRIIFLGGFALGFILIAVSSLYSTSHSRFFPWAAMVGFVVVLISGVFFQFGFRCPRCRKFISAVNTPGTSLLSFPNFCANCGLDFSSVDKNNQPI